MRNFLLAGNVAAIAAKTTIDKAPAGALGFYYMGQDDSNNQVPIVDVTGKLITGYGQIVMGRASKDGGPIIIPFYNKDFSYSKSTYSAAKTFTAKFTVPEPVIMCDHTVIFTKKGIQFNERSNWTASIHVFKDTETAEQVAAKIANYVNNNTATLGLTATVSTATVTVTATKPAVDYEITTADALSGTTVTYTTHGELGIADAEAIKKMANMAAADAGFEYTYMDDVHYLYPNYPFNPNAGTNTTDTGYTVYTLRFAVPRDVKTRDELVHQIVQIAIPTGATQIATMDTILAGIKSVA